MVALVAQERLVEVDVVDPVVSDCAPDELI
jgi:hypothetical protein